MLLSIARSDDLVIYPGDITTAYSALSDIEESMHKTFSAVGKYDHAADTERLLAAIREDGELTSEEIHQRFYAVGSVDDIGKMIQMLRSQGVVEMILQKGKKPTIFRAVTPSKVDRKSRDEGLREPLTD
jgi:transcription initiation factor IIE alpha subunit